MATSFTNFESISHINYIYHKTFNGQKTLSILTIGIDRIEQKRLPT